MPDNKPNKDQATMVMEAPDQAMQMGDAQLELQEEATEYYIQRQLTQQDYARDNRNEHMKKSKLGSIRQAVQSLMPEVYTNIDKIRNEPNEDMRATKLHHGRTRNMTDENGNNILKLDLAGSGFSQFRTQHKGFQGKNNVEIEGKKFNINKSLDKQLDKEIKQRWYHSSKLAGFIPGIRTVAQLEAYNEKVRKTNAAAREQFADKQREFAETFGRSVGYGKNDYEHMRRSMGKEGTRITLAGPLALMGGLNMGDYSIEKLQEHTLTAAADYLSGIFEKWNGIKDAKDVHIVIKGHSRGAVASAEAAMRIKAWVHDVFLDYEPFVKFDLTQYDPVAGTDAKKGLNEKLNLQQGFTSKDGKVKLRALGDSAETTVFYSMHANEDFAHRNFFDPQAVMGAKRLILTPFTHDAGLSIVDKSKVVKGGIESQEGHRQGYTDARTGEVYMGSSINDLDPGVYIVDEHNTLIRFNSYAEAEGVLKSVLKDAYKQDARHNTVLDMAKCWFERSAQPKIEQNINEFARLHAGRHVAERDAQQNDLIDSADALFANLPVQIAESHEALQALEANDVQKLMKLVDNRIGTNEELPALFNKEKGGYTNKKQQNDIREHLSKANPLNRLLLNKSIDGLKKGFVTDGTNAYYSTNEQLIAINKVTESRNLTGAFDTLFHELGHMTDNVIASNNINMMQLNKHLNTLQGRLDSYIKKLTGKAKETIEGEVAQLNQKINDFKENKMFMTVADATARLQTLNDSACNLFQIKSLGKLASPHHAFGTVTNEESKYTSAYYNGMEKDYTQYRENYIAVVYGEDENAETEQKLNELIKERLYWDIVARAEETEKRGGDMKIYGGSFTEALKLAAQELHEAVEGKSIEDRRKWLKRHDPLTQNLGMPLRMHHARGISDIFGAFAMMTPQQDNNAEIVKKNMVFGHSEAYWKKAQKMSVTQDGAEKLVSENITSEAWAQMTATNFDGGIEQEMFYREFMPNGYEAYKKLRVKAVKQIARI